MKINLDKIKIYYLTHNNKIRKEHIINEFKNNKLYEINPIIHSSKNCSGSIGFSRILDLASKNQDRTLPFEAFIILEDDVKKYREFPEIIEIPDDTDILYIGLSEWGTIDTNLNANTKLYYDEINDDIIRIYNMLSLHGIIICSISGMLALQKCMLEGFFKDIIWDIFTAQIQPFYNVYALKKPLVYQYKNIGGVEDCTKIEISNKYHNVINDKLINKSNISNISIINSYIPKNIFTIINNENYKDNEYLINRINKWKQLNDSYFIKIFTNNEINVWMINNCDKNYNNIFTNIKDEIIRNNFFIYCYLYKVGGYFIDINLELNNDINTVINDNITLLISISYLHKNISFSILGSCSYNSLIKNCIESIIKDPIDSLYLYKFLMKHNVTNGINYIKEHIIKIGNEKNILNNIEIYFDNNLLCYSNYESNINELKKIFKNYNNIEKNIHISWKNKNILNKNFNIIKYGILNLKNLNPEYNFMINTDEEIELYIINNISKEDYDLIKNKHLVEKTDLWRLLKIYNEGGIYMDLDRFCNIPLEKILTQNIKCILPMHFNIDFSQDIMISCSKNIIHKRAIELNLERRRNGCTDILTLGPITYFNAITEILLGYQIDRYPKQYHLDILKNIIKESIYISTYIEQPPYNTITYNGTNIYNDKDMFYKSESVNHWTINNPNDPNNKPYGK